MQLPQYLVNLPIICHSCSLKNICAFCNELHHILPTKCRKSSVLDPLSETSDMYTEQKLLLKCRVSAVSEELRFVKVLLVYLPT